MTPTLGQPPVTIGSQEPSKADAVTLKLVSSWIGKMLLNSRKLTSSLMEELVIKLMQPQMPFTFIANITGLPAMSVPLHWFDSGLPCGVQFIGRFAEEAILFQLAAQLEKAQPWIDRRPELIV
jgi:amidase